MRFLLVIFFLAACEAPPQRTISSSYYGAETQNQPQACSQFEYEITCKSEFEATKRFKEKCREQNRKLLVCNCDHYECVDNSHVTNYPEPFENEELPTKIDMGDIIRDYPNLYTGVDYNGKTRTCTSLAPDIACTMEFTKEDAYGLECRKQGYDIVLCGCHDPICLKDL